MESKKVLVLVGTRPNFIKVTQFKQEASKYPQLELKLIHASQHYDYSMSGIFFEQLKVQPDFILDIPHKVSANLLIASIIQKLDEYIVQQFFPDLIVVVGDVNSTLAGALVANKRNIKLAHVESGLRSGDRSMPEEINRVLVDQLADLFFVTEKSGQENLLTEGKELEQIAFVGNTMIDTLIAFETEINRSDILEKIGITPGNYGLMTMHRPATVDNAPTLKKLLNIITWLTEEFPLVFPLHPRTNKQLRKCGLMEEMLTIPNLFLTEPVGYFEFQKLIQQARFVITDSGGIQEETTFCKIPCLTLRPNTERPVTIELGTNTLLNLDLDSIKKNFNLIKMANYKSGSIPPLWDGMATKRIMEKIAQFLIAN